MSYPVRAAADLGEWIRLERTRQRLTGRQVEEAGGPSSSTMYRIEAGDEATVSSVRAVLGVLGYELVIVPRGQP